MIVRFFIPTDIFIEFFHPGDKPFFKVSGERSFLNAKA